MNVVKEKSKYIALVGSLAFLLANNIYDYLNYLSIYYIAQSFAFVCYAFVLSVYIGVIGRFIFWICLSQFFDEIVGNPLAPNIWEYLGVIIFVLYEIYKKWLK